MLDLGAWWSMDNVVNCLRYDDSWYETDNQRWQIEQQLVDTLLFPETDGQFSRQFLIR